MRFILSFPLIILFSVVLHNTVAVIMQTPNVTLIMIFYSSLAAPIDCFRMLCVLRWWWWYLVVGDISWPVGLLRHHNGQMLMKKYFIHYQTLTVTLDTWPLKDLLAQQSIMSSSSLNRIWIQVFGRHSGLLQPLTFLWLFPSCFLFSLPHE